MKITFNTKLIFGFLLSSLLTAAIGFFFDYFQYFGVIHATTIRLLFISFVSVLFGTAFGYAFGLYITRNIKNLSNASSVISKGDLRQKIAVIGDDELGALARTFNTMIDSLVGMVQEVKNVADMIYDSARNLSATSENVNAFTREISSTMQNIARGAETQAEMGSQTNHVTKDLAQSIDVVAGKADAASRLAQEVYSKAQEGNIQTRNAVQRIGEIAQKIEHASMLVEGFRERTLEINNAVRHIATIAQQTHLLALNATIEAARAGEHGRGFAVVAEEVRKLSHETKSFAGQISELAQTINSESQQVLSSMADSNQSASQGKEVIGSVSKSLQDIISVVQASVNQVHEITQLTKEQTLSASRLVAAIEEIARIAEANAAGTEQATAATQEQTVAMQKLAASALELSQTSDRLKSCIAAFQY